MNVVMYIEFLIYSHIAYDHKFMPAKYFIDYIEYKIKIKTTIRRNLQIFEENSN